METEQILMGQKELKRWHLMELVKTGKITLREAGERIGVSYRQAKRIGRAIRDRGIKGLVHGNRGRPLKGTCQEKKIFREQEEAFFSGERCGCENGTPFGSSEQPPPYKSLWLPILFISNASRKSPFFLTQNKCY
jgi:hypothetical protein